MEPLRAHANAAGHVMQFRCCVRYHMAHDHAAQPVPFVVYVYAHLPPYR